MNRFHSRLISCPFLSLRGRSESAIPFEGHRHFLDQPTVPSEAPRRTTKTMIQVICSFLVALMQKEPEEGPSWGLTSSPLGFAIYEVCCP